MKFDTKFVIVVKNHEKNAIALSAKYLNSHRFHLVDSMEAVVSKTKLN